MSKYFLAICSLLIMGCIFGCSDKQIYSGAAVIEIIDDGKLPPEERHPEIAELKIIKLQTLESSMLSNISQIEVADSLIVIKSGKELLLFDMNGGIKTKIGQHGRGPGEYISMCAFYIDPLAKEIIIVDNYHNLLIKHNYDGKHTGSLKLPDNSMKWGYKVQPTGADKLLVANQINRMDNNAYTLISTSGQSAESVFPVEITTGDYAYYFASAPMTGTDTETHFILPFDNRIYRYSNGEFDTLYMINTPQPIAPPKVLGKINDYNMRTYKEVADAGFFPGFSDIFETDAILFLNYLQNGTTPAFYIIDKNAQKGTQYIYSTEFSNGKIPFLPIIGCYGDYFIASASVNMMKFVTDEMAKNAPYFSLFKEVVDQSREDDNDCLIFYRIGNNAFKKIL